MTLALREKGIPARYITGFTTGKLNYNENSGRYEKTINENSLHAWVEVYSDDFGWIPFDPTGYGGNSGFGDAADPSQTDVPPVTTTPQITTTTTQPPQTTTPAPVDTTQTTAPVTAGSDSSTSNGDVSGENSRVDISVLLNVALAVLIITFAAVAIMLFANSVKNRNEKRMRTFRKSKNTVKAVKNMYSFIMKLFAVTDIAPEGTELPEEFALRADQRLNALGMDTELVEVIKIIEKAEFSAGDISEEERTQVYAYTKKLYSLVLGNAGKVKRLWLKVTL